MPPQLRDARAHSSECRGHDARGAVYSSLPVSYVAIRSSGDVRRVRGDRRSAGDALRLWARSGQRLHQPRADGRRGALRSAARAPCSHARRLSRADAAAPRGHQQVRADQWRAALADEQRFADWSAFFSEELRDNPWRAVVRRWTARLAPGVSAAATHGVIRVGHAVRALAAGTSPMRLASLADGLAYWAATYQELPVREVAGAPTWRPRDAITRVALVPPERRRFAGTIGSSLEALADWPDCATAIGLLDVSGDLAALTSELAEVFARVYLANARDALSAIVFIHAVTSTAAVSHIRPYLDVAGARALVRFVWQAGCGLFAAFGSAGPAAAHPGSTRAHGTALIDLAIEQGDEHGIKFTEACLHQDALAPSAVYPAAARHALGLLRSA
ncbi:MAG: questin oxidase family protein [Candidatus Binatia bacterium]